MIHKKHFIKSILILLTIFIFSINISASRNPDFDLLISHIKTEVQYNYSRRYVSFIIDEFLLTQSNEFISQFKIHENELLYIQIEDKEMQEIEDYRSKDFARNVVLDNEYYYKLVKPYSYLYLGFSILENFNGFYTLHYFTEASRNGIMNYMDENEKIRILNTNIENEHADLLNSTIYNDSFTSRNGDITYLLENAPNTYPEDVYGKSYEMGSLYEIKMLKPYGIFYRKISLDYLYEYLKYNIENIFNEDFNLSKKDYIELLKTNLTQKDFFDPTNFFLDKYIFRG